MQKRLLLNILVLLVSYSLIGQIHIFQADGIANIGYEQNSSRNMHAQQNEYQLLNNNSPFYKNITELKCKLDSCEYHIWDANSNDWVFTQMIRYQYDTLGHLTQEENKAFKSIYYYDDNGNQTYTYKLEMNETTGVWDTVLYNESAYDHLGRKCLYARYLWTGTGWQPNYKIEFSYSSIGNMINKYTSTWNTTYGEWIYYDRVDFNYSENGFLADYYYYRWNSTDGTWTYIRHENYEYNEEGNMITYNEFRANGTNDGWKQYWRYKYDYDERGNLIYDEILTWEEADQYWKSNSKQEYIYNESNIVVDYQQSRWDKDQQLWILFSWWKNIIETTSDGYSVAKCIWNLEADSLELPLTKEQYYFDENSNLISKEYYNWDKDIENWTLLKTLGFEYSEKEITLLLDNTLSFNVYKLLEEGLYIPISSTRVYKKEHINPNIKYIYHYSDIEIDFTSIEKKQPEILLFPNPAKDFIIFQSENHSTTKECILYDMNGKIVLDKSFKGNMLDLHYLPDGLYLLKIKMNGEVRYNKIIIQE